LAEKYDTIGIGYNLTRRADPYLVTRFLHHLNPRPNNLYLDIGCGTGNYTKALHAYGIEIVGVDPSYEMLARAKSENSRIKWKTGRAENIPMNDRSVDGIIVSLTIHHWPDLKKGFQELSRVAKPDSRIVIFTATPSQMKGYWLNHYFPNMMKDSMIQMPTFQTVVDAMAQRGFNVIATEDYSIKADLEDLFLYSGKHKPELYLDKEVRHGISSFSSLANGEEVAAGLRQLKLDIASGRIKEIIHNYKNDLGDYLFLLGKLQKFSK